MKNKKTCYEDYCNFVFRQHFERDGKVPKNWTEADRENYHAISKILDLSTEEEREILKEVFGGGLGVRVSVNKLVEKREVTKDKVWCIIKKKTKDLARRRDLI